VRAKCNTVHALCEKVRRVTQQGDFDRALWLIHDFVERIITEPLCTSQVYGSKSLDDLCQYIGNANLENIKQEIADATLSQGKQPVFVYLVTKLQKSGGHTRVIEDFIKAQPDSQHIILSTELDGKSDVEYLINGVAKQSNIIFEKAPKANYQQRLTWLQERLLNIHPERVYLFNHHQDSIAVAAIQPEMGLDAWYYHHGDHHLCLGIYLSHLQHVDPNPMGYRNCRDVLGIENLFVPLAVDDKGCRPSDQSFMQDGFLTTCTAAKSNKIEKSYFVSYLDVVPELLHTTGGKHIHIGKLTPWAISRINRTLRRKGVPLDRFVYIPWVPSVWNSLRELNVDLYLSSFPIGGALTMIEAMGAGVPVLIHKHISSRFLSCIDLANEEAFCWRHVQELIDICTRVTPGTLKLQSLTAREQYEKYHRREIFEHAIESHGMPVPDVRPEPFTLEADETACMIERQISLSHLIFRSIYRLGKRVRARL
jgi:hypothetical protein